ncbi:MAG TPA: ATP-binding protein [Acidobacteriaceae bacterium]|nr:ATP-binding protein [Acidobacteriaceae bacterium]
MNLRQKLLLMFSITVVGLVVAVAWIVSVRVRHVFEGMDQQQTAALVSQFQREFSQRANDAASALDRMAASDAVKQIAFEIGNGGDASSYLQSALPLAQEYRLDYLELVAHDGSIISSFQWTARFGYREPAITGASRAAFLKQEDLPDGTSQIGIFAVRTVPGSDPPLYVVGGRQIDADFLKDFPTPAGTQVFLYRNLTGSFDARNFGAAAKDPGGVHFQSVVDEARNTGKNATGIVYLTKKRADSVDATAIPLKGLDGSVLAVLVVANSRRGMVEVQGHIRDVAFGVAGLGIIFAVLVSLWIAVRVSRPIEELARAAGEVAAGDWETRVEIHSRDEVGALARSFNNMTRQLSEQRDRLVQTERVAAWRELARRLAHELKNPLFPLQITVENMVRARSLPASEFDEVFIESAATLQMEIANLKTIIGRFSDFSKMPKPQAIEMDAREAVRRVVKLYGPALEEKHIQLGTSIASEPLPILGDSELLHRALSNLVLNAMDAMPTGGTLTISVARAGVVARIAIADTGEGMTPEERERLFTPYYTTRQHGTGLGLAIVQSVITDHNGTIAVESADGGGTRFLIGLPLIEAKVEA